MKLSYLRHQIIAVIQYILYLNWRIASILWEHQNRLIQFLVGNTKYERRTVLACGLAGTIYVKQAKETTWKSPTEKLAALFKKIKAADIKSILSSTNVYSVSIQGDEIIVLTDQATGNWSRHSIPQKLEIDFNIYITKNREHQEAVQEFLKLKADKQKNKDKKLLSAEKEKIAECKRELSKAWQNQMMRIVQTLLNNPKATIVYKKFDHYLSEADTLLAEAQKLKQPQNLFYLFQNPQEQKKLSKLAQEINTFAKKQLAYVQEDKDNVLSSEDVEMIIRQNNHLLDTAWAFEQEILDNIKYICELINIPTEQFSSKVFREGMAIASILRGLDKKLETRGRDSCGLSIMLVYKHKAAYRRFKQELEKSNLQQEFEARQQIQDLGNHRIDVSQHDNRHCITFTFKIAKAVGQLGDNVKELKGYLSADTIFRAILQTDYDYSSTIVHTRWASQGIVSVPNCHPVDNKGTYSDEDQKEGEKLRESSRIQGHIYAVLNGDIDNHLTLREKYLKNEKKLGLSDNITTDAKVIPLTIENFVQQGFSLQEAFLKAVNEFSGSFAIQMHSDLEPGKVYLAQQGRGQGLYVGISAYGYHVASEIYGFVEQTSEYIAMEPGQVFVLDQDSKGGVENIQAVDFNGANIELSSSSHMARTPITTRDIYLDTDKFSHFLEKEIHESSEIITKTLRGKWECNPDTNLLKVKLGEEILPEWVSQKLARQEYRKFIFLGMGTAHAAAEAVAANLRLILGEGCGLQFECILATEFTATYQKKDRNDTLAIAISQSGGTTDTNAAVQKLVEDQADVFAIVNKRDSDITFVVDGILYTGDGRDVEIAVASTKAFYAQVVAGTLYGLAFAQILGHDPKEIHAILVELLQLPDILGKLFQQRDKIAQSALNLAPKHIYWDTLSTGIGHPVAKEVKIKLSELCYMSIPEFYAANKKHVNLSAEAMILCFFGALQKRDNQQSSLSKDLQGEVSIFLAQKNIPVVFTTQDDTAFDKIMPKDKKKYQLLKVIPPVSPYLCVILNTAAGHLWSYYAAKALNRRSEFISEILEDVAREEAQLRAEGEKSFNILKNRKFKNCMKMHYENFRAKIKDGFFDNGFPTRNIDELEKLFLATLEAIPASSYSLVFGENWGTERVLDEFKSCLSYTRTWLYRSIDAIKHQAKYITVGVTGFEGIASMPSGAIKEIFQQMEKSGVLLPHQEDVNEYDMITLTNIQHGILQVTGGLMYKVYHQNGDVFLKTLSDSRFGDSKDRPSRYDKKKLVKGGRKAMALFSNKVHIGRGHDDSNAMVVPLRSLGNISKLLILKFVSNENLSGHAKIDLLGGINSPNSKAEQIFTIVQENREKLIKNHNLPKNIENEDFLAHLLQPISVEDLLMLPHEDISSKITSK